MTLMFNDIVLIVLASRTRGSFYHAMRACVMSLSLVGRTFMDDV